MNDWLQHVKKIAQLLARALSQGQLRLELFVRDVDVLLLRE